MEREHRDGHGDKAHGGTIEVMVVDTNKVPNCVTPLKLDTRHKVCGHYKKALLYCDSPECSKLATTRHLDWLEFLEHHPGICLACFESVQGYYIMASLGGFPEWSLKLKIALGMIRLKAPLVRMMGL